MINMPVAKKFQQCEILGKPFVENGRKYVTIETPFGSRRNVRWYSDTEYARMYKVSIETVRDMINYRKTLGFGDAGYITIYYGNTYQNLDWFRAEPNCRYHKIFGWYTISDEDVPAELPEGVKTAILNWEDVSAEDGKVDEARAKQAVEALTYEPSTSEFVGEIGQRLELFLTVDRKVELPGMYGISIMHIMHDEDDNVFIWTTASKSLDTNVEYHIRGTIKDHRTYKNVQQTILTRCTIIEK